MVEQRRERQLIEGAGEIRLRDRARRARRSAPAPACGGRPSSRATTESRVSSETGLRSSPAARSDLGATRVLGRRRAARDQHDGQLARRAPAGRAAPRARRSRRAWEASDRAARDPGGRGGSPRARARRRRRSSPDSLRPAAPWPGSRRDSDRYRRRGWFRPSPPLEAGLSSSRRDQLEGNSTRERLACAGRRAAPAAAGLQRVGAGRRHRRAARLPSPARRWGWSAGRVRPRTRSFRSSKPSTPPGPLTMRPLTVAGVPAGLRKARRRRAPRRVASMSKRPLRAATPPVRSASRRSGPRSAISSSCTSASRSASRAAIRLGLRAGPSSSSAAAHGAGEPRAVAEVGRGGRERDVLERRDRDRSRPRA